MKKPKPETFADRLRAAIAASGRKVADLAAAAGLDRVTVYQLLRGGAPDPRWSTVQALARAIGISTEDFRCRVI